MSSLVAATASAAPKRLRILALHGFMQSAESFRLKTGALRKALRNIADIDYLQAPHTVTNADPLPPQLAFIQLTEGRHYAFWKSRDGRYNGWRESVEHLRTHVQQYGPYDAYLGFSQAAAFLSVVAAIASWQRHYCRSGSSSSSSGGENSMSDSDAARIQAAAGIDFTTIFHPSSSVAPPLILVSGFAARVSELRHFFPHPAAATAEEDAIVAAAPPPQNPHFQSAVTDAHFASSLPPIDAPTLHFIGTSDEDVPPQASFELARCFNKPMVHTHAGGHLVPSNAEIARVYKAFLQAHTAIAMQSPSPSPSPTLANSKKTEEGDSAADTMIAASAVPVRTHTPAML